MPSTDKNKSHKPSGHVRHDNAGRAVWQWAVDSGKQTLESTSRLLKKLDLTSMQYLDFDEAKRQEQAAPQPRDQKRPIPTFGGEAEADPMTGKRQGFDPYNMRAPAPRTRAPSKKAPPNPHAVLKSRIQQPAVPAKKPGLLGRLFGFGKN